MGPCIYQYDSTFNHSSHSEPKSRIFKPADLGPPGPLNFKLDDRIRGQNEMFFFLDKLHFS